MLDRDRDFGTGFAYGRYAHPRFLLNETVQTMDGRGFREWLGSRRERWLGMIEANPDGGVQHWSYVNRCALSRARQDPAEYLPLYLPRTVFGCFVREILSASIERARRNSLAQVDFVAGEAVSLTRIAGEGLCVGLRDGGAVHGRRVVLGLGSLPSRLVRHLKGTPGYIHDLPREEGAILRAFGRTGLADRTVAKNVVVVGANAAAMEAIYTVRHDRSLLTALDVVIVITPSGSLPDGEPSRRVQPAFVPPRLKQLDLHAAGHSRPTGF